MLFGKIARSKVFVTIAAGFLVLVSALPASASTSVSYDFNVSGSLAADFNSYVLNGSAVQSSNGGIGNSGAIYAASSADAVFASKSSYSIGPIGSSYRFTALLKSVGNNGYSGVGFTAAAPASDTSSSDYVFRPSDAMGISVHGGGFVLHNGNEDVDGGWSYGGPGITTVKSATIDDLLNSGSPDNWYKIVFRLVRVDTNKFDTRIEVWSAMADGSLIRPDEADAIFEWNGITNTELTNAPSIYSYINFSGYRVEYFDNYQVQLGGGASVIAAGAPVVLTDAATQNSGVVNFQGSITADGGSAVTERGFVYSTTVNPTINDNKLVSGSGIGTFTGSTSALPNGTYYFRAFATSATGTSYGTETEIVITNSSAVASSPAPSASSVVSTPSATPTPLAAVAASTEELPQTGFYDDPRRVVATVLIVIGAMFVYSVRIDLMTQLYYEQPWLRYDRNYNLKRAIWSTKYPLK